MNILHNVRTKIWACVSVALLSYLIATLSTTWVNHRTKTSITHIQQIDLPLSSKGILVQSLFNTQSDQYENGLLTGESSDVLRANSLHEKIAPLLENLVKLAGKSHHEFYPRALSLRDNYHIYYNLASQYYMEAVLKGDIFTSRKEVHQLGKLQANLAREFQDIAETLQAMVALDLENNNQRIDRYTRMLHALFILFLCITTLVINWLANREIIAPLARVSEMIKAFGRGKHIDKPQETHKGDEIQELAISFWQMTHELHHITASRDYISNIIDNMSDSLIILDPDLTIQSANQATLNMLQIEAGNLHGYSFREIFCHEDDNLSQSLFQGLLDGKPVNNLEALYQYDDNPAIPILFSASGLYLADGNLQGISCLAREISELTEQREQLQFLANFDNLTGLPNRNLFYDRLELAINEAKRYNHTLALLYLDLDQFKPLNDRFGHEAGDLALQEVAKRLRSLVRETDTVSRIGGDEFVILLSRVIDTDDAIQVANKVLEAIRQPFIIQETPCNLGVSIGICLSSLELTNADTIMNHADTAMYAAKAQGRNGFIVYTA